MCEACLADMACYKQQLFNKFFVLRARKTWDYIEKDMYGITRCNGPELLFKTTPWCDPMFHWTEEQMDNATEERWQEADKWIGDAEKFEEELFQKRNPDCDIYLDPIAILAIEAFKDGYNPETDGRFGFYLFHKLGEVLKEGELAS